MTNKAPREGGHALRIAIGIMILALLIAEGVGAVTEIDSCTSISSPGEYVLNQSIINSGATRCINITASNVTFDGQGNTIDGLDTGNTYGVYVYNSSTSLKNNTVKNLAVTDWDGGIYYIYSNNGSIENNIVNSNKDGISLSSSSNNIITNNTANSNYNWGILSQGSNNTLINNRVNSNIFQGIQLYFASNNTLRNNTINNSRSNFMLQGSISEYYHDVDTSNTVDGKPIYYWTDKKNAPNNCRNSEISDLNNAGFVALISCDNITVKNLNIKNNWDGILLVNTTNSNIINNLANTNENYGIRLYLSSNNSLNNNSADGISLAISSNNNLNNNSANSNIVGISLFSSSHNIIKNNGASGNTQWDFHSTSNSINNTVINLTINPTISFTGKDISIKSATTPASDPSGYQNIGKYINAANNSADSWLFLNVSYNDSEVTDLNENTMRMWKYNGTWSQVSGTNGVETTQNYVYANLTSFSIFAPMASTADRSGLINISSCTTISSNGSYLLNQSIINSGETNCINITASNVTFDGQGNTIDGLDAANTYGVYVYNSTTAQTNVTVQNLNLTDWYYGIYYGNSQNGSIVNNTAISNIFGIYLYVSSNNTLSNNTVNSNNYGIYINMDSNYNNISNNTANSNGVFGIILQSSSKNTISKNTMTSNVHSFHLDGGQDSHFNNTIDITNTVDGKPVYYIKSGSNTTYDSSSNAGIFYCIWCDNITIKDLIFTKNGYGVFFWKTSNSKIENVNAISNSYGIRLVYSSNNIIANNTASGPYQTFGIILLSSSNNTLINNTAWSNSGGILLTSSSSNTLNNNTANSNGDGISLDFSNNNNISNNTASSNSLYGIRLYSSNGNTIYNNYFRNQANVFFDGTIYANIWNTTWQAGTNIIGGLYIGGNFWAFPNGTGFSQICSDANKDGICDTNYTLNSLNIDYLPLAPVPEYIPPAPVNLSNTTGNYWVNHTWQAGSGNVTDSYNLSINSSWINGTALTYYNNSVGPGNWSNSGIGTLSLPLSQNTISPSLVQKVHNINRGTNYSTIQAAIDDSSTGDEIHVDNGTYYENVNLNKQLVLKGLNTSIGKPVVDGNWNGNAITLSVNGITVDGFTIINASIAGIMVNSNNNILNGNNASNNYIGISLSSSSSNNTIIDNNASNNNYGFYLVQSSNNNLTNNTAINNIWSGIRLSYSNNNNIMNNSVSYNNIYSGNSGFYIAYSSNNNIISNSANNNYFGIYLDDSNNNTIIDNNANNNHYGIMLIHSSSSNNTIIGNNANNNTYGINIWSSSNNNITNNAVSNNSVGIHLLSSNNNNIISNIANNNGNCIYLQYSSNNNTITHNNLNNNGEGIILYNYSNNNIITQNNVYNNSYGIFLIDNSSNNMIYNNFFKNINNFYFQNMNLDNNWNITRNFSLNIIGGPYLGGNFWANPSGTGFSQTCADANKDGICDSSYTLTSGNVDYLPLTIPAGYGYISGKVMNNSIGIAGTIVTTNTSNTTNTDASGMYSLLVPAGTYNLTATSAPRFYTNSSIVVKVISGSTVTREIELSKKPTGTIRGNVTKV